MSRGRYRMISRALGEAFKGVLLGADERVKALELRRRGFPPLAIARALGRPLPTVTDFLNSPEAKL